MRLMEGTECEMSAPGVYDIDVTDTVTVVWEIVQEFFVCCHLFIMEK